MLTKISKILSRVVIRSEENLMNLCGIILVTQYRIWQKISKERKVLHQVFDSHKDSFIQKKPFAMSYCFDNKNNSCY